MLDSVDRSIAAVRPKVADQRYRTADWRKLRAEVFARDGHRCTAPGCTSRAVIADHIVSPKNGGSDVMSNLRSLCRAHDNQVKEDHLGERRSGGQFR